MAEVIIGSTALKFWFPEDFPRKPNDLDIVTDKKDVQNVPGIEYLENPILLKYQDRGFIRPSLLLTLKMSHLFWDFKWKRHMYDVQFLLNKGYKHDAEILNEFIEYWEETKPKVRRSNLELSAEEFFDNAINKDEEEHDFLHTLINPVPMYTRLLKDGAEVELDENKWNNLTFEEKCDVVFEETAVMGYERYKSSYYKKGFEIQLNDNIMKHFPKYIAIFAIINYKKLITPKFNFINTIKNGLRINQQTPKEHLATEEQ